MVKRQSHACGGQHIFVNIVSMKGMKHLGKILELGNVMGL